jgi:cystathionine beta-lyase
VTDGAQCGKGYDGYVRLIFAMPLPILEQAVLQMRDAVLRHTAQRQNVHSNNARTGTP